MALLYEVRLAPLFTSWNVIHCTYIIMLPANFCWVRMQWKKLGKNTECLLIVEFPWNPGDLSKGTPVKVLSKPITIEMITKAIGRMDLSKSNGPSGIIWASSRQNLSSGYPTKRDSNQSPKLQRLARKLKFHSWQVSLDMLLFKKRKTKAQTGLRLCCSQTPWDSFSRIEAHITWMLKLAGKAGASKVHNLVEAISS